MSAIDEENASRPGDLDPIVLGVISRRELHVRRIDDLEIADPIAGEAEGDDRLRVEADAAWTVDRADERMHFLGVADEMPSERKFVVAVVEDQRAAARLRLLFRQALAEAGTCQAVALRAGLDLMRMERGSPIAPCLIRSRAFVTGG